MSVNSNCPSPREEGELEDGEICDDEAEEKQQQQQQAARDVRPSGGSRSSSSRKGKSGPRGPPPPPLPPVMVPGLPHSHPHPHFRPGPHLHAPQFSPRAGGPERQGCEPSPRSSFWERSHGALGRLRYRGRGGKDMRADWSRARPPPPGRFAFGENHGSKDSPTRRQKQQGGRNQVRKPLYTAAKSENGVDESFEDLLMKYKQIQMELECIRKEEKMALKPGEEQQQKEEEDAGALEELPFSTETLQPETCTEMLTDPEKEEKRVFQAFNIRPLRQKLLTPAQRDLLNTKTGETQKEEDEKGQEELNAPNEAEEDEESESDLNISLMSKDSGGAPTKVKGRDEDDELSELQLRLLALQSASRRWQQKEQQVIKESKEKLTRVKAVPEWSSPAAAKRPRVATRSASVGRGRAGSGIRGQEKGKPMSRPGVERGKATPKSHPAKKTINPGPAAKQAWRKQQLRMWKLQRQKHEEEEERRKREEEIRKIRDLSNQDEQYNRFMKLVGGKQHRTRSKSLDTDHRKPLLKQGLDASGNLYQYDNYDEVAMETDSETNSPVGSPVQDSCIPSVFFTHVTAFSSEPTPLTQDLAQYCVDTLGLVPPPPPPPLPPPDEHERPPKPPFADEEEEEEMMLREELLKSLASKRGVRAEDGSSNSGPPSPVMRPTAAPSSRSSATFIMAPSQTRSSSKFGRTALPPRSALVLPRHKSVVVRLNASDDSDSESEASSSAQCVFGGLESMIKEARRTVEASKPRPVPVSGKENNPFRTPETLPEAKKMEYRLLREELASLERQRVSRTDTTVSVVSHVGLDSELDTTKRTAEIQLRIAEEKFIKHRVQLEKDQALLEHLFQQELKKKESLKAAEAKVARLKEQLLASEKVASANRLLLRKLQEQVQRVQHRVVLRQQQSKRLERELLIGQAGEKRISYKHNNADSVLPHPKRARMDVSDSHYSELIAQKKRLQQLESEYALKIQKLKEAQALRQAQTPGTAATFDLPQPSLHDLTQDKLTLASEDAEPDEEELQPAAAASSARRRSFRESGSFTKPNLSHPETPAKHSASVAAPPPELLPGLNVEDLHMRYQRTETLTDLLQKELRAIGGALGKVQPSQRVVQVDFDPMAPHQPHRALNPVAFGPYHSPLLVFRSYRFSPYFRTKEKLPISSISYSNMMEPRKCFCRFDVMGTCNDDNCQWQHMRNCTLTGNQLFQDILSYSLPLIGCSEESSTNEISRATEKYIKKLFGANKDRMGTDQKAVLLVSKVNESLKHVPPYTTYKEKRKWRPEPQKPQCEPAAESDEEDNITLPASAECDARFPDCWPISDVCVTQDDKRYFDSETDDISNLEYSVLESPRDVQLWIKLAYKYLNQKETSVSECLDAALNTLSRALEDNQNDVEVWCHYLSLFSRRGSREELEEMCEMAVEHAPHYQVWWTYLNVESTFEGKDTVCSNVMQYLLEPPEGVTAEELSFQLLETLLYRAQLSVFTGRLHNARQVLQDALVSEGENSVCLRLLMSHRALAWLCYIHLCEFDCLPSALYDPANSNPSRLANLEPFLLPWSPPPDLQLHLTAEKLTGLFQDALSRCVDDRMSPADQTLACLPLHTNHLHLLRLLGRGQEAVSVCEGLLSVCPSCCPLLDVLSELHLAAGEPEKVATVWLHAHSLCPHDARIFYHLCKRLHMLEKHNETEELFGKFVLSLCDDTNAEQTDLPPVAILQHWLGVRVLDLQGCPPSLRPELQDQLPYLSLTHSVWQAAWGSVQEAEEAFEAALGTVSNLELLHEIWMDYLHFSSRRRVSLQPSVRELRAFTELLLRCVATVPCRLTLPHSSTRYCSSYTFHNQVISFFLSCLPPSRHTSVLERLRHLMPTNTELALRCVQQEWRDGNSAQVKLQSRTLCSALPSCLAGWKIAIAVQREQKGRSEVQKLYQQALQKLPLCADLWRDWLLFEAAGGGKSDTLKKLVGRCQAAGVSLTDPLTVEPDP